MPNYFKTCSRMGNSSSSPKALRFGGGDDTGAALGASFCPEGIVAIKSKGLELYHRVTGDRRALIRPDAGLKLGLVCDAGLVGVSNEGSVLLFSSAMQAVGSFYLQAFQACACMATLHTSGGTFLFAGCLDGVVRKYEAGRGEDTPVRVFVPKRDNDDRESSSVTAVTVSTKAQLLVVAYAAAAAAAVVKTAGPS